MPGRSAQQQGVIFRLFSPPFKCRPGNVHFPRPPQDADSHLGGADADDSRREESSGINQSARDQFFFKAAQGGWSVRTMTKPESKKSGVAAGKSVGEQVNNGSVDPACQDQSTAIKAKVMKQTSRENLHRRNTECEVYDDGTNTFFW